MAKSTKDIKALLAQMTLEEKVGQLVQFNTVLLGKSTAEITGPAQKMGIDHDGLKYAELPRRRGNDRTAKNAHG